jgi:hypothetical protein
VHWIDVRSVVFILLVASFLAILSGGYGVDKLTNGIVNIV